MTRFFSFSFFCFECCNISYDSIIEFPVTIIKKSSLALGGISNLGRSGFLFPKHSHSMVHVGDLCTFFALKMSYAY